MKLRKFLMKVSLLAMVFVGTTGVLNQVNVYADDKVLCEGKTAEDFKNMSTDEWIEYRPSLAKAVVDPETMDSIFRSRVFSSKVWYDGKTAEDFANMPDEDFNKYVFSMVKNGVDENIRRDVREARKMIFEERERLRASKGIVVTEEDSVRETKRGMVGAILDSHPQIFNDCLKLVGGNGSLLYLASGDHYELNREINDDDLNKLYEFTTGYARKLETEEMGRLRRNEVPNDVNRNEWNRAMEESVKDFNVHSWGGSSSSTQIHDSFLSNSLGSSKFDDICSPEGFMPQKFDSKTSAQGSWNSFGDDSSYYGAANSYGLSADPEMASWTEQHRNSDIYKQDASSFLNDSLNTVLSSSVAPFSNDKIVESNKRSSDEGLKSVVADAGNIDSEFKNLLEFVHTNAVSFYTTPAVRDAVINALKNIKNILQNKKGTPAFDDYVKLYKATIGRYGSYLESLNLGDFANPESVSLADLKGDYGKQVSGMVKEINEIYDGSREKPQDVKLSNNDSGSVPFAENSGSVNGLVNGSKLGGVPVKGVVSDGKSVNKLANGSSSASIGLTNVSEVKKPVLSSSGVSEVSNRVNVENSQNSSEPLKKIAKLNPSEKQIKISRKNRKEVVPYFRQVRNYFKDLLFNKFSRFDELLYFKGANDIERFYDGLEKFEQDLGLDNIDKVANAMCDAIMDRFEDFEPKTESQKKAKRIALKFAARVKKDVSVLVEKIGSLSDLKVDETISFENFAKKYNRVVQSLNKFGVSLDDVLNDVKTKGVEKNNSKKAATKVEKNGSKKAATKNLKKI